MGTNRTAALLTYFSLVSHNPCLLNIYYCIQNFHGGDFTVFFNSPWLEHSDQLVNKPAPCHSPTPEQPWTAASAYFLLERKSLTWWITSSTSCDILRKTTVGLGRTLMRFTGFSATWDGKFWVLLCGIYESLHTNTVLSWRFPVWAPRLPYSQLAINELNKQGCPRGEYSITLPPP